MLTAARRLAPPTVRRPDIPRWAGFALIPITEACLLTFRFDLPCFTGPVPWWLWPLDHLRMLLIPAGFGLAVTAYLSDVPSHPDGVRPGRNMRVWVGHGLAFAAFVVLTARVLEGCRLFEPEAAPWLIAWYAAGLAVLLTWQIGCRGERVAALLRPRGWLPLVMGGLTIAGACYLREATKGSWTSLSWGTLVLVRLALGTVAPALTYDPDRFVVGTGTFAVRIAPGCSGYEGIGLIWTFLLIYLAAARRSLRWPHAWWLVPLGTLAVWLENVARITALILIGAWWSPEVAAGGFHLKAGSLGFLTVALGLLALSRSSRFFRAEPMSDRDPAEDRDRSTVAAGHGSAAASANPTAAHLAPFLAVVATTMATGALLATPGFDPLYPIRIAAGALALAWCRQGVPGRLFGGGAWAIGAGLLVLAVWLILEPRPTGPSPLGSDLARLGPLGAAIWLTCRAAGSAVVVPLAEEWAFRGYLTRRLIARDFESVAPGRFTWFSFLASSFLFGLLHGRWLAGTLAGLIYAGVYYRRGRVGDAALAHAVTNAGIAALVLATGDGKYWS